MLKISEAVVESFNAKQTNELAARLLGSFPALGSLQNAHRYIAEALDIGLETDRDIAEFVYLLLPFEQAGRPGAVRELLADPHVDGPMKLFQVGYHLNGPRA